MSAYDNACMSAYDKVNTVKLPPNFQFIPVNSRLFPLIPVESFQLWIFPEFCNPSNNVVTGSISDGIAIQTVPSANWKYAPPKRKYVWH